MKKKILYTIGAITTLMIINAVPSFATTGTITADSLKLRSEASSDASVIDMISQDSKVEVQSEEGNWYKVTYGENSGYVSKDYVTLDQPLNATNDVNISSDVNSEQNTESVEKVTTKINTQLHILPIINSNVLKNINAGTNIEIITKTNNWAFVVFETVTGWIPLISISETTANTVNVEDTQTNGESQENKPQEIQEEPKENEQPVENKESPNEENIYSEPVNKYVNSESIYVRSIPNTSGEAITSLILNTDVSVIGENGEWYKVRYDDIDGYIRKDLLSDQKTNVTSRGEVDRGQANSEEIRTSNSNTENTTSVTSNASELVNYAKSFLGCPYSYGASGPSSFDCSGFVMYVFNHFGISLPHGATSQSKYGTAITKEELKPGDIVFFLDYETMDGIGHCGIYIGNGDFIHASSGSGYCVKTSTLLSGSYKTRYYTARRLL